MEKNALGKISAWVQKNYMILIIIVLSVLILGVVFYGVQKKYKIGLFNNLSSQQVGQKVLDYVNENIPEGTQEAELLSTAQESGVYKFKIKVQEEEFEVFATKDGKILFLAYVELKEEQSEENQKSEIKATLGSFSISEEQICKEEEKPILYFFGTQTCPHCLWEHPIVEKVAKAFEAQIAFHNNMDSQADSEVFAKYSEQGYVPAIVIGCRYFRVGSGENLGQEQEEKNLKALICNLTDGKPSETCDEVRDIINQI